MGVSKLEVRRVQQNEPTQEGGSEGREVFEGDKVDVLEVVPVEAAVGGVTMPEVLDAGSLVSGRERLMATTAAQASERGRDAEGGEGDG